MAHEGERLRVVEIQSAGHDKQLDDHETRIRKVEDSMTKVIATATALQTVIFIVFELWLKK